MANYFYKGKEVRSRSDRDRDVKLSWAHTVTLKHTDINFRVMDSVASFLPGLTRDILVGFTLYCSIIIFFPCKYNVGYILHKTNVLSC